MEINMKATHRTVLALLLGAASAAAIGAATISAAAPPTRMAMWLDKATAPIAATGLPTAVATGVAVDRTAWWETGGPAYRWNEILLDEMQQSFVVLPMAARHLALFHAALDDAIASARQHKAKSGASEHAAAAEVAAAMLAYLFPGRAEHFEAKAREAIDARKAARGETAQRIAAGRELGRKIAATAIARGKADGSDAKWSGTVPEGPDRWKG